MDPEAPPTAVGQDLPPPSADLRVVWPVHFKSEYSQYPGVMSISALLKQHGVATQVVEADIDQVSRALRGVARPILAYSTPTTYYGFYRELNERLRRDFPHALSVFGGPHPTYFPEMIGDHGVDAVCRGEGEHAMLELACRWGAREPITGVRNWWVRQQHQLHKNPLRPLIADLDGLPLPDHEAFSRAMSRAVEQVVVITGRGCPHRCTYCYNHVYRKLYGARGKAVRRRSVDNVMRELRVIRRDPRCRFIRFVDDLFIVSSDWLREFTAAYTREIGLPFSCMVRANYVTPEIVQLLRRGGCYRVLMGLEAGNHRVRNEILKRRMSSEVIVEASRLIRAAGIKLVTANIVAIPGGSFEADWETLELNFRCKPDYASVQILQPFPRTEIHQFAEQAGLLDGGRISQLESSIIFGLRSPLKYPSEREKRLAENLHKFFALTSWYPRLAPLVRQLVKLPPNRLYDALYHLSLNLGIHLHLIPPRIGLPMIWRKLKKRW